MSNPSLRLAEIDRLLDAIERGLSGVTVPHSHRPGMMNDLEVLAKESRWLLSALREARADSERFAALTKAAENVCFTFFDWPQLLHAGEVGQEEREDAMDDLREALAAINAAKAASAPHRDNSPSTAASPADE